MTKMGELVPDGFVLSVASLAVTVALPRLLMVTLNVAVPLLRAFVAGTATPPLEQATLTTSVIVLTRFQVASTA